jgi:dTDP-4-dehydrorhamnose reductase
VQRLLVTGGYGYLGREVVRLASETGWDVRATWWRTPPSGAADWVQADVRDRQAMKHAADGMDAVVHTAYVQSEADVIVDGTAAVAEAAHGKRFVHLSSDIVFDGTRGRYREDDPPSPINPYGRAKTEAERLASKIHGAPAIVRTSLIYGGAEPGPQERLAREATRFFVDELRSPVQVVDLATAIVELLPLDTSGPLHLAGADDISRYDFAVLLGADPDRIEGGPTTPDRCPNVTLDSSYAASLLGTRLRGVYEVLSGS